MTTTMTTECPEQVQIRLLAILQLGLLNIRSCAERQDHIRCGAEANHLHNIPALILDFSQDKLQFYMSIEVPQYLQDINNQASSEMRQLWKLLTDWMQEQHS
jgi:hypothetical protein